MQVFYEGQPGMIGVDFGPSSSISFDSLCTFCRQTKALGQILLFTPAAISSPVY